MIIGDGSKRLWNNVSVPPFTVGSLGSKEFSGLACQYMAFVKIGSCIRDRAFVSDAQASWLFTILTRFEQGTNDRSNARRHNSTRAASPHSSSADAAKCLRTEAGLDGVVWPEEEEGPKAFDISDAIWPDSDV